MKKIIVLAFCFVAVNLSAQSKDPTPEIVRPDLTPTEKGKPDGELVSKKIGPDGGRLISSDNKVELNIPAGALAAETTISIQPFTSTGKGGVGKSYNFEPSGIRFQQPVQLALHYTEEELDGESPQLLTISTQNEKGVWYRIRKVTLDTSAKTISGNINHFSHWTVYWAFVFIPDKNTVKVSNSVKIFILSAPLGGVGEEEGSDEDYRAMLSDVFGSDFSKPRIWSVNGIAGGNMEVGTIVSNIVRWADYTAPARVPDQNPVEVMLEIIGGHRGDANDGNFKKKCKITVYDNLYEVKLVAKLKDGDKRSWAGETTYYDEGSFIVSLDTKTPTILDIKNNLETVTDNCRDKVILNHGENTGMIHIAGVKKITATPVESTGGWETVVEIAFDMRRVVLSLIKYNCPPPPGHNVGNSTPLNIFGVGMMQSMPAQPVHIKFIAKEGEQIIEEKGTPGGPLHFKISVKQVKDD